MRASKTMDKLLELNERVSKLEARVTSLENAIAELREDMKELKKSQRINTIVIRYVIPLLQIVLIAVGVSK
jgi:predicted  nucleic acid-binding Zn-ribbon protein